MGFSLLSYAALALPSLYSISLLIPLFHGGYSLQPHWLWHWDLLISFDTFGSNGIKNTEFQERDRHQYWVLDRTLPGKRVTQARFGASTQSSA